MARPRPAPRPRLLPLLALLALLAPRARAWDSGDLELFDLVEEVPRNFYDFLGVQQVSEGPSPPPPPPVLSRSRGPLTPARCSAAPAGPSPARPALSPSSCPGPRAPAPRVGATHLSLSSLSPPAAGLCSASGTALVLLLAAPP